MNQDIMEITEEQLNKHTEQSNLKLKKIEYTPKYRLSDDKKENKLIDNTSSTYIPRRRRSVLPTQDVTRVSRDQEKFCIYQIFTEINKSDELLSDVENHVIRTIRRAIKIYFRVDKNYSKTSGLISLKENNLKGSLDETGKVELREKLNTSTLVSLFTFANYISFTLENYKSDLKKDINLPEILEINLENSQDGIDGALYELMDFIKDYAKDDVSLLTVMRKYASSLSIILNQRKEGLQHLNHFEGFIYRIEKDKFEINGFELQSKAKEETLVMSFKRPDEVIGNHIAKYQAQRIAKMLMCYDFEKQKNPFVELGGFIFTWLGDGKPGTGKTTLIQMMGGLLNDYCKVANYPFRYRNFDISKIDSYQGKSGQHAKEFVDEVMDKNYISFGTIDDIDQIAGKRGDTQSSSGQQEVTAIFMGAFAGSGTIVRGNSTFGAFTNYADNLDDALRQRFGLRYLIDGPQTLEDYIDITSLLLGKNHEIPLGEHDLFKSQNIKTVIKGSFAKFDEPNHPELLKIFKSMGQIRTMADIGKYLHEVSKMDDRFTGRAIKNITDSIKTRAMDFEMPDEWFEDPSLFLHKSYDYKLEKIKDLMEPITIDMVIQETNRYIESELRYSDSSDTSEIDKMVSNMINQDKARELYLKKV